MIAITREAEFASIAIVSPLSEMAASTPRKS